MALIARKTAILAEAESSYGVDPTPTGSANAILVRNLSLSQPMGTDYAARDLVRPYLGNSENLPNDFFTRVEFEVEMAGAGTAGEAPAYGPLLKACAFSETLFTSDHSGTAQAGASTTITLAAGASASDDLYNGKIINLTGGTGSGQSAIITDYNGTTKVATIRGSWATTPDNTTTYAIPDQAVYSPVSSSFGSVTIYFNVDGVLHAMLGCRGTVSLAYGVKQIPVFRFSFMGIYQAVVDSALPTAVYTAFQKPLTVSKLNTPAFNLHGYSGCLSDLSVDVNNEMVFRSLVGCTQQVLITDRKPSGSITIEAPTVAQKDYWDIMQAATLGTLHMRQGTSAGNIVDIISSSVQLTEPQYSEADGLQMLQMGLVFVPSSSGNDELDIIVR